MIRLMGLEIKDKSNPDGDIEITYTGLHPGEKPYEELLIGDNPQGTDHPRIMRAQEVPLSRLEVKDLLNKLDIACHSVDCDEVTRVLEQAPLAYTPSDEIDDLVWNMAKDNRDDRAKKITEIDMLKKP